MRTILLATGWLTIITPFAVHGLGLRIPDQDPRAIARGNAFVATADNPSAIYYNPAGITQLSGHQMSLDSYVISLRSEYESSGYEAKTRERIQMVPQAYYTYSRTNWPVAFGLGLYAPYGLGLQWPDDVRFQATTTRGELIYLTLNPVVAWKIHPNLSLAVGPTFSDGKADLRRRPGLPSPPFPPGSIGQFKFTGDDTDVGYNAGLRWQPREEHAFGATYRSATTMNFDGHTYLNTPGGTLVDSASARMSFPQQIVVGYSYRPTPVWNLEVNVDWTDWDVLNDVVLKQSKSAPQAIPFNYQSSFLYEFGVTRVLTHGYAVSGGYLFSGNSVPTRSWSPGVPDSDRHIFSVGLGKQYEHLRWDAGYQFAYGPTRSINTAAAIAGSFNGDYTFFSHALALSLGIAF